MTVTFVPAPDGYFIEDLDDEFAPLRPVVAFQVEPGKPAVPISPASFSERWALSFKGFAFISPDGTPHGNAKSAGRKPRPLPVARAWT